MRDVSQKLIDAGHRVSDGGVPLGKLIRDGHQNPMSARVRYEYAAVLRELIRQCGYEMNGELLVNICDILHIIEELESNESPGTHKNSLVKESVSEDSSQ